MLFSHCFFTRLVPLKDGTSRVKKNSVKKQREN
jgi:hypothetical protein